MRNSDSPYKFYDNVPRTWSTLLTSIWSKPVLFQTYWEFGNFSTHSWIRFRPSSLSPFKSGYSGSDSLLGISSLRPPAKITSIPSPNGYSMSCKAVAETRKILWTRVELAILGKTFNVTVTSNCVNAKAFSLRNNFLILHRKKKTKNKRK